MLTPGAGAVEMSKYVYPANRAERPASFTYAADGESYYLLSEDSRRIEHFDTRSGELIDTLFNVARTREAVIPVIEGFTLSADASKVLVWRDAQNIYRRSFTAQYYVYDVHSRIMTPLSRKHERQRTPIFSPDSRMVAFVADNNIHIAKLDYKSEVSVTTDGKENEIISGAPDWVYEEEFTTTCSMTWAPDNLTLCYLRYDQSETPLYPMMRYGENMCPEVWTYRYPVAGAANSRVTLHSYDVETRKIKDLPLPDNRIEYIPRIEYGPDAQTLVAVALNRDQSICQIYKINPKSTVAKELYNEESATWIKPETYENLVVEPERIVVTSWRDGNTRLYFYNYNGVEVGSPATGEGDITAYYGADDKGNIYYQAAAPTPLNRVVRCLDRKGKVSDLSPVDGDASATFAPGMKYAVMCYSNPTQVPTYTLVNATGKSLRVILDNAEYAAATRGLVAAREFFSMTTGDGTSLNGYVIKPANFRAGTKYPTIMYQYSGPESQEVRSRWQLDWMDAFAAEGYVVICVDGRGTGGRGRAFCDIVHKRLGLYETRDQLEAARYASRLPYVDASRIAIYGWSYGGYEALMAATAEGNPYKAAVAIAPVTDWRFYDSIYAERYLQTPGQNDDGYNSSAPIHRINNLSCPLLMMYGTSDDNVHPANTLQFVAEMQRQGKVCDMFVFPDMNHSINGGNARSVVFVKMLDWLNKNL